MKKALLLLAMCLMALSNAFGAVTWYLQEDFESGQIPQGWTQQVVSTNEASWVIEARGVSEYPDTTGNSSNYHMAFRNLTEYEQHYVVRLITPAIDLAVSSVANPQLVFKHAQVGAAALFDTLKVYCRASANSQWTLLRSFDRRIDVWSEDTIPLIGFSGSSTYQIAFEANENLGRGIVLDDVRVMEASTCVTPSGVGMTIPGTTSVTLAWAGGLETDTFEVVVSDTAMVNGNFKRVVYRGLSADFSEVITGLTPQTDYYAYVRAKCYDNETGWTGWASGTFRTRARIDIPYVENFGSSLPEGWVAKSDLSGKPAFSAATAKPATLASYSVDSTFAMQFSSITAGKYACAITPQVNLPSLQGVEVGFWGYAGTNFRTPLNSSIAKMYVGVVNDPEDVESLVIVDSVEIKVASKHQHFTVSFENYAGTGKYLVFLVSDPKRSAYFYIDHLTVDQPAVLTPTDVQIVNASPDGFDVKVNLHGASQWNLRVAEAANYKHMNVLPSSFLLSQDGINGNTYHVTGSYGNQIVAVYAQAVSGTNTSAWSFPTTLRIPARATLPLIYEFDDANDASVPVKSLDNEIHISNSNKTFPNMYFPLLDLTNFFPKAATGTPKYENTSHMLLQGLDQWVALPYVDSYAGQMVSFRLAAATEGQSRVAVGIMKDAYDLSTFTKLAEFDGPLNEYRKCEVDLDGLDSLGHYVAIMAIKPKVLNTNGSVNHIDALHVEAIPACPEALDINAVVADTAISLTWATRGMNHWLVELFDGTKKDSLIASKDVTAPEVTFGGLNTLTDYYYRVNTWCGNDTLHGNGKIKFTTKCEMVSSFPWSEDFEDVTGTAVNMPCWDNEHTAGTATTKFTLSTTTQGGNATKKLYLGIMAAGNRARVSLPEMVLPNNNYEFLISMYRNSLTPTKTGEGLRIFASDGENETELAFIPRLITVESTEIPTESGDGWYTYELSIPMSGNCRIIIQGESESGTAIYADNLMVRESPSCQKVKKVTISNVTASSATASWTPRGNESQWQYLLAVPGQVLDWSNATVVGTPSASFTGLNGSSSYDIWVRAYCSASDQSEAVKGSFHTNCGPITSMPWGEGFEAFASGTYSDTTAANRPPCWDCSTYTTSSVTTSPIKPHVVGSGSYLYTHESNKALTFYGKGTCTAVLPDIAVPLNTLKLTFWYRSESASNGELKVGYIGDDNSFHSIATFGANQTMQQYEQMLVSVPTGVTKLAFQWVCELSTNWTCCVDDILLEALDLSCPGLADLTAESGTPNSITISWTAAQMMPTNVEISDSANFAVVRTFPALEGGTLTVDSLEQNHYYYVRARQVCDAGGEWKSTVVKTLCDPVVPGEYPMQDFENANDLDCWLVGVSVPGKQKTDNPSIGNLAARGHYLYFNKAATSNDTITKGDGLYAIMPMMDVDSIKGYEVGFKAFKTSTSAGNAGRLTVGVVTDPTDFSTFTAMQNMKLDYAADSLSEKEYTVNFLNYQGDYNGDYGKYIVFYAQSGDSLNQIGVDKVEVRTVASCPRIVEGMITDTVSNGATYRWEGTGAPAYEVVLLTERMDPDSAFTEVAFRDTVSTDSIVIRGISPSRMYYAFVRGLCDDNDVSRWSAYTRFRTPCGIATVPYAEKFDDTEALNCFTVGNRQSTAASYIPSLQTSTSYLYNSQQSLKFYAIKTSSTNADSAYVILPEMNYGAKGLQGQTLSFYGRSYGTSTTSADYNKKLKVGVVSGEDMSTFRLVKELTLADTYSLQEVSFEEYAGNGNRIVLLATINSASTASSKYCYAYLDDISVFQTPTCKSLASLNAKASRRTIDVTIVPKDNGTPDHYDLVYSPTALSLAQLEAAEKISVDTTGLYTIRGLDRETQYYIYARANCGAEDGVSEWSSVSVATKGLYGCDDNQGIGLDATTTSAMLPMSSNYNYGVYEQIYTAAEIGRAGRIGTLSFFNTGTTKSRRFEMYLLHTTKQEFSSTSDWVTVTAADKVFAGEIEFVAGEWTPITLDKVFEYDGTQNLLLVVHNYTGSYSSGMSCKTFAGTNQALYKQQDSGDFDVNNMAAGSRLSVKNQLLVGFCYDLDPCPAVTDLTTELLGLGVSEAMVRWNASEDDYLSGCDVIISDSVVAYPDSVAPTYANVQGDSLHVTGLNPETLYYVYVRAICKAEGHDEGNSVWVDTTFETLANCPAVIDLTSELSTAATTVKVSWGTIFEDQALNFAYVYSLDSLDKAGLASAEKHYVNDTTVCEISGLEYGQTYHIYVASVCGTSLSPWTETVIETEPSCAPVRNLTATRIEHNRVVLSWNRSRFGSETQWEAGIVGDSASIVTVSDTAETISTMLIGLTPETPYVAYVRALCGAGETSVIDTIHFTTKALSNGCITVGTGTTDGYLVPFNNLYKNAWTQTIYTADEIGHSGTIGSLWIHCKAVVTDVLTQSVVIYLGHTQMALSSTTTDWVPQSDLVQVYANPTFTHPSDTGWIEFALETPFEYNGTDNLAVVFSVKGDTYKSGYHYAYTAGTSGVTLYRRSDSDATCGDYPTAAGNQSTNKTNFQFCFNQAGGCEAVTALKVNDIRTTTAVASWEPMGTERSWEVYVADTTISDFTGLRLDTAYHYVYPMSNLQDDKDYWFYVRPICGGDWKAQKFTTVAICSAPIELDYDSVTSERALVSWNDAFSVGSTYIVAYGLADSLDLSNPATYQTKTVQTPYAWIDGLEEVTMYGFAVQSVCEGGLVSRFSEIATFQTPCALKPLGWSDSFENEVYCWYVGNRQSTSATYKPSIISSATTASNAVYVHTGVRAFKMYAYKTSSTNADSAYVIVPEIDYGSAGIQGATVRFYARSSGSSTTSSTDYYKHVEVGVYNGHTMRTYQKVKDVTLTDNYEMYEVPLTDYTGDGDRIVFLAKVNPSTSATTRYCYVYFDDFEIIPTPTCWRPTSLNLVAADADSASFSWTGSASQWQYVYALNGTTPDWSNATLTSDTAVTVHGLTSGATTYAFYVRAYCSATDQSEARSVLVTTPCGLITELPWYEGFETKEVGTNKSPAPDCWKIWNANGTTYPYIYVNNSASYVKSGSKSLYFVSSNSVYCYATLPQFAMSLNTLQISFYHKEENATSSGYLDLGYMVDDSTFVSIMQFNRSTAWQKERVMLNVKHAIPDSLATSVRLAFRYGGSTSNNYYMGIDDITVDVIDFNCAGVTGVQAKGNSLSSATIEWLYGGGNRNAQLQIATDERFENIVDSATVTNDSTYLATGLQSGTFYYVRVRQVCADNEFTDWTDGVRFETCYGIPFAPQFTSTTIPADWTRSNTQASQVFAGDKMQPYNGGWTLAAADTVINDYHIRGYITGTTWHYWMVTPAIDMQPNVGEGLILSFDAGMVASSSYQDKIYTGTDDRFLVAVSIDGGETWNPANVTEWNNSGTGDYVYNDVPTTGRNYYINMSDYTGNVVKIGFYGESSVTNAYNYFHVGNIHLETVETTNYVDTICEGNSFNKHGFNIPYEELPVGLNTFSRYDVNPDGTLSLSIQQVLVSQASVVEIPLTLCEGEHYNGYGFDFTVTKSEEIRKRIDNGNQFGCDSTVILQVTMLPTSRTEVHVGCNEDSYTWHGKTYYQSTIVSDTTASASGCDSITTLYLTMCENATYSYYNAFCEGSSYSDDFFENLTAAGQYNTTVIDELGCETYANLTLRALKSGQDYTDSVHVSNLPYVLGNDTLCPETDQAGFVYHGSKDFGCGMVNVTIYVYDKVALNNIAAGTLKVAPNPVRIGEDIKILTSVDMSSDYSCRVFDAVGKLVYETNEPATTIPGLPVAGAYTVRISSGTAVYQAKLIVK